MLSNLNEFGALEISMFALREIGFLSPTKVLAFCQGDASPRQSSGSGFNGLKT